MKAIILAAAAVATLAGCMPNYSEGERTGVVQKISEKGLIWKSIEGEMLMGGLARNGSGDLSLQFFHFTVVDPALAEKIALSAERGDKVTLRYREWLIAPPWYGTDYIILGIKEPK